MFDGVGVPALVALAVLVGLVWWALRGRGARSPKSTAAPMARATNTVTQHDVVHAILAFRKTVNSEDAEQIRMALEPFKMIPLEPKELAGEVKAAECMLAWLAFRDRLKLGEGVPVAATMSDGDSCYFRDPRVWLEQRRENDLGRLDIADKGIFYDGVDKRLTLPWAKIRRLVKREAQREAPRTACGGAPRRTPPAHRRAGRRSEPSQEPRVNTAVSSSQSAWSEAPARSGGARAGRGAGISVGRPRWRTMR